MKLWHQALEVARVDLRVERRLGDTFRIILPFAIVALMIFSLAMGAEVPTLRTVGPAVFWSTAVLFGMQVALRISLVETPQRRDLTMLLGLDPAARFLGRALSSSLLISGFLAVLFAAMWALFDPELPSGWPLPLILAIGLAAIGLGELATLASEVAVGLRNRSAIASLIIAPLAIPVVVGASQVLEAIERGTGILVWILLLVTVDLALLVAGVGLSRPLEEASR
jgi:heme exporter protein B